MQLYEMIYSRLVSDTPLGELLASYNNRPAVFYQRPATADDNKWDKRIINGQDFEIQYPRINYFVDLQENPSRNTGGTLTVHVFCDAMYGAEPEEIDARLKELLHITFAQTDDYLYCLSWLRSDAFEVKSKDEETIRTYGVTVIFDLVACPSQLTLKPDPIKGMNEWTKTILQNSFVVGMDAVDTEDGWLVPTRERPVIYWRITAQGKAKQTFVCTWLDITIEGHVYCRNAADRLYNLIQINTAYALAHHIPLEDGSPLFLKSFNVQPHMNYTTTGQIRAVGNFGLLQPWYGKPPQNPIHPIVDYTIDGKKGENGDG